MKYIVKTITVLSAFVLLAGCQMNAGNEENQNEIPTDVTTEYTVSFDFF